MIESELSMLQNFSSNLQIVEEVVTKHLSELYNLQKIAINLSPLINQSLVCSVKLTNSNTITVRKLLKLFIERWDQEIKYHEEIIQLKDQIIEKFNDLCSSIDDETLIDAIREQRQKVIELIFFKTGIDDKQIAGEFCKDIMNGFEIEALTKINECARYVLWAPYTTPMPKRLIEFIKQTFQNEVSGLPDKESILCASKKIVNYIEDDLNVLEIRVQNNSSGVFGTLKKIAKTIFKKQEKQLKPNELKLMLDKISAERKMCSLMIEELKGFDQIIKEERKKIEFVKIRMHVDDFIKTKVLFFYESLELNMIDKNTNFDQVVMNIPKGLKYLYFSFKQNDEGLQNMMKFMGNEHIMIDELIVDLRQLQYYLHSFFRKNSQNQISYNLVELLANFASHVKFRFYLIIDQFINASIASNAMNQLAISLNQMDLMMHLELEFGGVGGNEANNEFIILLSKAMHKMRNLNYLHLNFSCGKHDINDEGIEFLSEALSYCTMITNLTLIFRTIKLTQKTSGSNNNNEATDKSFSQLAESIQRLQGVRQLKLNFKGGRNRISDNGIQDLAKALNKTFKLIILDLDFRQVFSNTYKKYKISEGKNCISDKGIVLLENAVVKLEFLLRFRIAVGIANLFKICNIVRKPPNIVTWAAINQLKNARDYKSFSCA